MPEVEGLFFGESNPFLVEEGWLETQLVTARRYAMQKLFGLLVVVVGLFTLGCVQTKSGDFVSFEQIPAELGEGVVFVTGNHSGPFDHDLKAGQFWHRNKDGKWTLLQTASTGGPGVVPSVLSGAAASTLNGIGAAVVRKPDNVTAQGSSATATATGGSGGSSNSSASATSGPPNTVFGPGN